MEEEIEESEPKIDLDAEDFAIRMVRFLRMQIRQASELDDRRLISWILSSGQLSRPTSCTSRSERVARVFCWQRKLQFSDKP